MTALSLAYALTACMTAPYDDQRVASRASPVTFAGYHPSSGAALTVEVKEGQRWTPIATAVTGDEPVGPEPTLYAWSTAAIVLPEAAWVHGFRGDEARVRIRAATETSPMGPGGSVARLRTSDYVPRYSGLGDTSCEYGAADCNRCAEDVEGTFAELGDRRFNGALRRGPSGKVRYYANAGRRLPPDAVALHQLDDFRHHVEGFARIPGVGKENWFIATLLTQDQPAGFLLAEMRDLSGHGGERIVAPGEDPEAYFPLRPRPAFFVERDLPAPYRGFRYFHRIPETHHTGGIQVIGRMAFIPYEAPGLDRVGIYDLGDPTRTTRVGTVTLGTTSGGSRVGTANMVAVARMASGYYVLLVNRSNSGITDVYVSGDTELVNEMTWNRVDSRIFRDLDTHWSTSKNSYQNMNFVTDCESGRLYLVSLMQDDHFGSPWNANNVVHLYRAPAVGGRLTLEHVATQVFGRSGNTCEMRGGASVHVTPSGEMILYCTSGWASDRDIMRFAELTAPDR